MYKKIIVVCGMPRSGTSWLGQIFDSSPNVAFRMEPLFSYRFKNIINASSTNEEIEKFFIDVYQTDDDFITQKLNRTSGAYRIFDKASEEGFLVIKTTRHHDLLERYLQFADNIEIVSLVRHPCAAINSWIHTDREFLKKGCSIAKDWKSGNCRKDSVGEFWGFDDWLSVTENHVRLSNDYSNFRIVKYSTLVNQPERVTKDLFDLFNMEYTEQTASFLIDCHRQHNTDPYAVFKGKEVLDKWKENLDKAIAKEIIASTKESGLGEFLN